MVWSYVYGCNMHHGAEGDNSTGQFGTSRRQRTIQGSVTKKWNAVIRHTPSTPHHTAMTLARPWPVTKNEKDDGQIKIIHEERNEQNKARLNARACPELGVMHVLSQGKLPSKRLRFHFPDLFPEVKEHERSSTSKIFYQEPPQLVNTESLLRWMVPSVPWRYLQNHCSMPPTQLSKETQCAYPPAASAECQEEESYPRGPLKMTPATVQKKSVIKVDAGCQPVRDKGIQTDELNADLSSAVAKSSKAVVVLEGSCPVSISTTSRDTATQTERASSKEGFPLASQGEHLAKRARKGKHCGQRKLSTPCHLKELRGSHVLNDVKKSSSCLQEAGQTLPTATCPAVDFLHDESDRTKHPRALNSDVEPRPCLFKPISSKPVSHLDLSLAKEEQALIVEEAVPSTSGTPSKEMMVVSEPVDIGNEISLESDRILNEERETEKKKSKRHRSSKPVGYLLRMSCDEHGEEPKKTPELPATVDRLHSSPNTKKEESRRRDIEAESIGSSNESLEELERLIELQHAQLVAKGFLPPDNELESVPRKPEEKLVNQTFVAPESMDSEKAASPYINDTGNMEAYVEEGSKSVEGCSHGSLGSFSFDGSLYDSSLSKMMESLGMESSEERSSLHQTGESSEMERSAAAIAALTSYQAQLEDSIDEEVIYDVSISKDSERIALKTAR